jgi:hypothetical protein
VPRSRQGRALSHHAKIMLGVLIVILGLNTRVSRERKVALIISMCVPRPSHSEAAGSPHWCGRCARGGRRCGLRLVFRSFIQPSPSMSRASDASDGHRVDPHQSTKRPERARRHRHSRAVCPRAFTRYLARRCERAWLWEERRVASENANCREVLRRSSSVASPVFNNKSRRRPPTSDVASAEEASAAVSASRNTGRTRQFVRSLVTRK